MFARGAPNVARAASAPTLLKAIALTPVTEQHIRS
jgi:hypothetical protein